MCMIALLLSWRPHEVSCWLREGEGDGGTGGPGGPEAQHAAQADIRVQAPDSVFGLD